MSARQWIRSLERASRLVNPPGSELGRRNAVYIGTGRQHDTGEVDGWLSIKMMLAGSAVWATAERQFTVDESCYLILNDRHRYRLRFDSATPVTTFVMFFERGLVEDAMRWRSSWQNRRPVVSRRCHPHRRAMLQRSPQRRLPILTA